MLDYDNKKRVNSIESQAQKAKFIQIYTVFLLCYLFPPCQMKQIMIMLQNLKCLSCLHGNTY